MTTTTWWDGDTHKSRFVNGRVGSLESWRYMDGGLMVVRSAMLPRKVPTEISGH